MMHSVAESKVFYEEVVMRKVDAFKKIYAALREGQDNNNQMKSNFLLGKEALHYKDLCIEISYHKSKDNRTARAWSLANEHYNACSSGNENLVEAIVKDAINHTKFASLSFLFGSDIEQIRARIKRELDKGIVVADKSQNKPTVP